MKSLSFFFLLTCLGCSSGTNGGSGHGGAVEATRVEVAATEPPALEGHKEAPTKQEDLLGCGMTGWVEILDLDGDPVDVAGVTLPCEPFSLEDLGYPSEFSSSK